MINKNNAIINQEQISNKINVEAPIKNKYSIKAANDTTNNIGNIKKNNENYILGVIYAKKVI